MVFTPPPSPLPPRHSNLPVEIFSVTEPTHDLSKATPTARTRRRIFVFVVPMLLLLLCSATSLFPVEGSRIPTRTVPQNANLWQGSFASSLRAPHSFWVSHHRREKRRDTPIGGGLIDPVGQSQSASTPPVIRAVEGTTSVSIPTVPTPALPLPTPFPQPWDSTLSYNFSTATCLSFFSTQLANQTFRACRSFGLLFDASSEFFGIEANLTELTAVLAGTCDTPQSEDQCTDIMNWMADQMILPGVCQNDLAEKNSVAIEALYGFRSYDANRKVGCLVNPRTNSYCFAEALAQPAASDLYFYGLPDGTPLPNTKISTTSVPEASTTRTAAVPSFTPSCSTCVASIMAIYAPFASDPSSLLSATYPPAAALVNRQCGAGYAPGPEAAVTSPTPPVPPLTGSKGTGAASPRLSLLFEFTRIPTALVLALLGSILTVCGTLSMS